MFDGPAVGQAPRDCLCVGVAPGGLLVDVPDAWKGRTEGDKGTGLGEGGLQSTGAVGQGQSCGVELA